jgi:hypothetical protein
VIYIPKGDASDKTRLPKFYDGTFNFLKSCGLEEFAGAQVGSGVKKFHNISFANHCTWHLNGRANSSA